MTYDDAFSYTLATFQGIPILLNYIFYHISTYLDKSLPSLAVSVMFILFIIIIKGHCTRGIQTNMHENPRLKCIHLQYKVAVKNVYYSISY